MAAEDKLHRVMVSNAPGPFLAAGLGGSSYITFLPFTPIPP